MANHKDAVKRALQAENARLRNKAYRSQMRNQLKKIRTAIAAKDFTTASVLFPETVGLIQKLAQKGVIHARNASRHVSRLALAVNAIKPAQNA